MARKALTFVLFAGVSAWVFGAPQEDSKAKPEHVIVTPDEIKWGDAPAALPPGAKAALLDGDPKKEGVFILRLKLPAGYRIAPHWHPVQERVTVISGELKVGLGEKFDESAMRALPAGGFFSFPPKTAHFVQATQDTVIQLSTTGPWALNYVNPKDDPRNK